MESQQSASAPRTPPSLEYRAYEPGDRAGVIALWQRVFPDALPRNDPALNIERKLAREPELFLVATNAAEIVGTAMAGYDGHRGWLYLIAVAPERRRCGIGRALVERACELLAERGCPKVNLQIVASNAGVTRFYEVLGFSVEERISMGRELASSAAAGPARDRDC